MDNSRNEIWTSKRVVDNAYKSINELSRLLALEKIPHIVYRTPGEPIFFSNQIRVLKSKNGIWTGRGKTGKLFLSAICHPGSYGYEEGLIEVYNGQNEPEGFLNPLEALEILKEWLNE